MQILKVIIIAIIVFFTSQQCSNKPQQAVEETPYKYSEGPHRDKVKKDSLFKWPEGKKMGLTITFDDSRITQADNAIPILDKYNIKGTFYITPENMFDRMEKWRKAVKDGHEVGNHTLLHPCTGNYSWTSGIVLEYYTLETMREDIEKAGAIIRDSLGVEAVSFAYPCGQTFVGKGLETQSYVPLIASMFTTGRSWLDEGPNNPLICDMAQLMGMELDGKSFRDIKKLINFSRKNGNWLILVGHEVEKRGNSETLTSTLDAICKYAMDPKNEIWIDNIQNISSYIIQKRSEDSTVNRSSFSN